MFTRCTGCHTVHPVNARLLARAGGKFRCGKCHKQSNALDALFDEWPGAGEQSPGPGELPVLGMQIDLEEARRSRQQSGQDAAHEAPNGTDDEPGFNLARLTWIVAGLAVLVVIWFQYAAFRGAPPGDQPAVQSVKERSGLQKPVPPAPYRDLERIHLVARELKSHPVSPGLLRLSATIVNRADRPQPYPVIEVVLMDASGQAVSRTRFPPSKYLAEDTAADAGMTPEAFLPFALDLPDPGSQAVGFELNFH